MQTAILTKQKLAFDFQAVDYEEHDTYVDVVLDLSLNDEYPICIRVGDDVIADAMRQMHYDVEKTNHGYVVHGYTDPRNAYEDVEDWKRDMNDIIYDMDSFESYELYEKAAKLTLQKMGLIITKASE